ncbi:MAG: dihydroorotate dehydrogenase [bacterium]
MVDLSIQIGDLKLRTPVLVASGTFGYGQEAAELVDLNKLGGIITKSISLHPRPGNPPNRIAEVPAGMLNSIGLANVGVDAFIAEKLPFLRKLDTAVIVNVAGSSAEDFLHVIQRLEDEDGIDAYELNFSCPNVKEGGLEFSQNTRVTEKVTTMIRKCTSRTMITKLTPNVTRVGEIASAAESGGADAVSLINTLVGMAIDIHTRRPKIATVTGGYSGPAIKPVALAKVFEVSKKVDIPIIGIGGIMSGADAVEFFLAGASAIEIGTANFIDPRVSENVTEDIRQYCLKHHFDSVREFVGSLLNP